MDGRIALAPGDVLKLASDTGYTAYRISREIGRGGSCIVYDASYTDNLGNFKLVRVKECYPHAMQLTRDENGMLLPSSRDQEAFETAKQRLIDAYRKNHELFTLEDLTNAVSNASDIYHANGTVYIVSVYLNGRTFADYQGQTLHDCVSLILAASGVLRHIHEAGYLYLDLKPDNILTIHGSLDLVQLFDFDSMISLEELHQAVTKGVPGAFRDSYTKGYAPLEQQTGRLRQYGRHSDFFSLGAVLFYALWHRTPSAFDCDTAAAYDYGKTVYSAQSFQDRLFRALTEFFHRTLASYYGDRYQTDDEIITALKDILALSDQTKPWLKSTSIQSAPVFYGRDAELAALHKLLLDNKARTVSLYGMGGIGKSTLARQYIASFAEDWDAVLWLYDQGNLSDILADDMLVHINTISRVKEESAEEYLKRKLPALSSLAGSQRILLVLDNFTPNHLEQLKPIREIGLTVLLISRERLPEGLFPMMRIGEMGTHDLAKLFEHYSHCDLSDADSLNCFNRIIGTVAGHTLLTELIARQVAGSHLDLQAAESMVAGIGLSDLPGEKIDYVRDQSAYQGNLLKILDRLVEIERFTEQDKICMKLLSLFDMPGIEADLYRMLMEPDTLDFVNELERSGWVKSENRHFYLHPMMQEYIRTWPWTPDMKAAADGMMRNLYERIRPAGIRHDGSRQFPEDYGGFYRLIRIIPQIIDNLGYVSEASQRLLYRWLMDAPVDQDTPVLFRMLELLKDPCFLDDDSILRLYETAAYYRARLYIPDDAIELLREMRRYLRKHPSAYYLSAYHSAMAVILHNANRDLKTILRHEDLAISAARLSSHPEAGKQLAACLMYKARTLMSEEMDQKQVRKLIREAEQIVSLHTGPRDYERYQFLCNTAMCYAMDGDPDRAQSALEEADAVVYASPDSDLAVAEHLIDEAAPILMTMNRYEQAEDAVLKAIVLCEKHPEALRYRETVFDAYYFLGRIYAMDEDYIKAEEAFAEAEKRVHDWPYECKLPLCPEEVRARAEQQKSTLPPDTEGKKRGGNEQQ